MHYANGVKENLLDLGIVKRRISEMQISGDIVRISESALVCTTGVIHVRLFKRMQK